MYQPDSGSNPVAPGASSPARECSSFPAWTPALLLGLLTLALYWPATRHDFVNYDDEVYVTSNARIQGGLTLNNLKWAFVTPVDANWHPLTVLSHMLDCQLFGLKPWGHHLTSVLLHALNTVLVFLLLRRLTGATWRSAIVAALFGWHPLHVESVAWVAERKDVLSACFGLLALIFYARYVDGFKSQDPKLKIFYPLSLLIFACGLMSKAMLVTWPLVMLLLDYWPLNRISNLKNDEKDGTLAWLVWEKMPFFVLAAAACVITFVVQKHQGALDPGEKLPVLARAGNALVSYCRYLGKLFWPVKLAVFYPHPGYWPPQDVLLAAGLLTSVSVLFWWVRRRYPFMPMGWMWFLGTLLPVIQLVQTGSHAMADRYTYIPSLGVFIIVTWGVCEVTRRWRHPTPWLCATVGVVLVLLATLTRRQLGCWQDSETLFRHAFAVTENNYLAHNDLGFVLFKKGQGDDAIIHYREAIRMKPDFAEARNNLGIALCNQGRLDEAISQYQTAIRLNPRFAEAYDNFGIALFDKGEVGEAIKQYQEALRLKPQYAESHNNLGVALREHGEIDESINQCQEAIHLSPAFAEAHNNLGIALFIKGRVQEAMGEFQEAIRLKPDFAEARSNLGIALASQGRLDDAIIQFQAAVRLKPDDVKARNNLAHALEIKNSPPGH
jgi:Flp pilus assembly protein TadD